MIVIDASVVLEALLGTRNSAPALEVLLDPDTTLHAPHLIDLEVAQVVRRYTLNGSMLEKRGAEVIDDFLMLPIERFAHELLLRRVWELRSNITAYDAAYVALAEVLEIPLLTCDKRLASSSAHRARIELLHA